jgi:alpha-amylase
MRSVPRKPIVTTYQLISESGGYVLLRCAVLFACVISGRAENNLVYQVFVRSFADSPTDADRIGDLRGVRENLAYLRSLNAGIMWLMPVFPSPSYHGYDISNYRDINPDYGTLRDMDALIADAHRRGIRIILDIAFNHTSAEHPWFKEALRNPESRYRRFYHFDEKHRNGYLALFSRNMPDLNLSEPEVREELKAIAKFWLDRGIDGFRLDAAKHVFGDTFGPIADADIRRNNDWWREFSGYVYGINRNAVLVGEVLGASSDLTRHAAGLSNLLDAPFMHAARTWLARPTQGFMKSWLESSKGYRSFPFLASHDENPRLATYLEDQKAPVEGTYRVGMCLLLSIAKYPILYNGDELMQRGRKWKGNPPDHRDEPGDGSRIYDETLREPLPWYKSDDKAPQTAWFQPRFDKPDDGVSVEEQNELGGMLDLVRALTKLRAELPDFANGEIDGVISDTRDLLAFEKAEGRFLVLINPTASDREYVDKAQSDLLFWSAGTKKTWGREKERRVKDTVVIPAFGFVLLRKKS